MTKKESNSFFFEGEKSPLNFLDGDDEEDKIDLKKLHGILSNSMPKIEEDEDKDLNNLTSVSETDKVFEGEEKNESKKSKECDEIEDELNETSLTAKNSDAGEEKELKGFENFLEKNSPNQCVKSSNSNNNINHLNLNNINISNINIKNEIENKPVDENINIKSEIENEDENINIINNNGQNILNANQLLSNDLKNENKKEVYSQEKNEIFRKKFNSNLYHKKSKSPIFSIHKIKKRSRKVKMLRKKRGIHINRKKDADSIRRKIKTYFHNYLLNLLNTKINKIKFNKIYEFCSHFNRERNKKIINKYLKLNNKFTSTVNIKVNRTILSKKIGDILRTEPISSKYKAYDLKNNCHLTNYILSLKSCSEIHKILDCSYSQIFYEYLHSSYFHTTLKKLKEKDGEPYMNQFKNVSENFINYYNLTQPKNEGKENRFFKDKKIKEKENKSNTLLNNSNSFLEKSDILPGLDFNCDLKLNKKICVFSNSSLSFSNDLSFQEDLKNIFGKNLISEEKEVNKTPVEENKNNENISLSINNFENSFNQFHGFLNEKYLKFQYKIDNINNLVNLYPKNKVNYQKSTNIFNNEFNHYNYNSSSLFDNHSIELLKKPSNEFSKSDETEYNSLKYNSNKEKKM